MIAARNALEIFENKKIWNTMKKVFIIVNVSRNHVSYYSKTKAFYSSFHVTDVMQFPSIEDAEKYIEQDFVKYTVCRSEYVEVRPIFISE